MIISASRRTDIPAFYLEWLLRRLDAGFVMVRNPVRPRQVARISLDEASVDCFVYWTKDPAPMLTRLADLSRVPYYVQVTLNAYGPPLETQSPSREAAVESFVALSQSIGRHRVRWRYDPVISGGAFSTAYHVQQFGSLAERLGPHTEMCIFSFLDMYRKIDRRLKACGYRSPTRPEREYLAEAFSAIAHHHGFTLAACCEPMEQVKPGIEQAHCIDARLISRVLSRKTSHRSDTNQREGCGCSRSVDIGAYDTCRHGCLYCYANGRPERIETRARAHDPNSPLLSGCVEPDDAVYDRQSR